MTKLQAIFAAAVEALRVKLAEAEDDIAQQIMDTVEQSQEEKTAAKFKAGFSMTYDLNANALVFDLSYGVRKHWKSSMEAPDPTQTTLPMEIDRVKSLGN